MICTVYSAETDLLLTQGSHTYYPTIRSFYSATRLSVAIQQTFKFEKYILQLNHPCDVQTLLYFTLLNFNYTDLNTQYKLKMNQQLK